MKAIADGRTYKDGNTFVKVGPSKDIEWEGHILGVLEQVEGVPGLRGITKTMGSTDTSTIVMDWAPGKPLSEGLPTGVSGVSVANQVYTLVYMLYTHGVAHMRLDPENVIISDKGVISLVGFSKSMVLAANPIDEFCLSPDITGRPPKGSFVGPLECPTGHVLKILEALPKGDTDNATTD